VAGGETAGKREPACEPILHYSSNAFDNTEMNSRRELKSSAGGSFYMTTGMIN